MVPIFEISIYHEIFLENEKNYDLHFLNVLFVLRCIKLYPNDIDVG